MNHQEFEKDGKRYSLTGNVITIYLENGIKQAQTFYENVESAQTAFKAIA
ncbi:MAG: hypothetical protein K6F15_10605 [Treponema sp.]|nr:hypothetical protein [Treponema sp.]